MKGLGIGACVVAVLSVVFGVVATLFAIWGGDDRWAYTATLAFIIGLVLGGAGGITVDVTTR